MIVIVDYGGGNLTSVARAVSYLGFEYMITEDPEKIASAEKVIFPGVGAAGAAMDVIRGKGIDKALIDTFKSGVPMLGICVGCQVIMDRSEENNAVCLGLIGGEAKEFPKDMHEPRLIAVGDSGSSQVDSAALKVPHMGWNGMRILKEHPLFDGIMNDDEFYFVHSFYPLPVDRDDIYGVTEYGIEFPSAIGHGNLFATQYHLEKSGKPGLLILKNFCQWKI